MSAIRNIKNVIVGLTEEGQRNETSDAIGYGLSLSIAAVAHLDDPDADAVDLFLGNQTEVEQAAQERYAAKGAPDGVVELEHIDFI